MLFLMLSCLSVLSACSPDASFPVAWAHARRGVFVVHMCKLRLNTPRQKEGAQAANEEACVEVLAADPFLGTISEFYSLPNEGAGAFANSISAWKLGSMATSCIPSGN